MDWNFPKACAHPPLPSPAIAKGQAMELEEMRFVQGKEVVETEETKGRGKQALL